MDGYGERGRTFSPGILADPRLPSLQPPRRSQSSVSICLDCCDNTPEEVCEHTVPAYSTGLFKPGAGSTSRFTDSTFPCLYGADGEAPKCHLQLAHQGVKCYPHMCCVDCGLGPGHRGAMEDAVSVTHGEHAPWRPLPEEPLDRSTSPCKILKCNSDALRTYALCTRRTARTCRGDLAYHSAVHGIEDLMSQHNCSKDGPTSQPRLRTLPPAGDSQERSDSPEICHYEKSFHKHAAAPNYTHCGLFGDPHLRTFTDRFQTCKVQGAWPLIDNNYLNVQVTNTPVLPGSAATATSKLTIIFKNFQECVDQKVYQAEMDELPAAFADGSKNGGDKHGANSLKITEKVSGQHVEIQAKYIGTTIVVRQVGRYLTFAIRMPEEVVNAVEDRDSQGLYLCLRGCPLNQQIDFQAVRAQAEGPGPRRPEAASPAPAAPETFPYETAVAKCKEKLPVEDLYYQACIFDLLTTGDVNFTLAAYYALEDVKMLHSNKDKLHLYERTRELPRGVAAAALTPAPPPLLILLLLPLLPVFC
ncbi:Repulsive guidance molecule A [Fukomys damarensis]|uniref:Repulsive guidance molecule A n=1 Tax=Fukomys damarensis TaxID=885580 RepID=A0A091DW97_FUKDA|nr:Repulsive guidance molecule A [Fukomys damarensis]